MVVTMQNNENNTREQKLKLSEWLATRGEASHAQCSEALQTDHQD